MNKEQISVALEQQRLFQMANETKGGTFGVITGYTKVGGKDDDDDSKLEDGSIEVASYAFHFGINYGRAKQVSQNILNDWLMGKIPSLEKFTVKRGMWKDANGLHIKKAAGRTYVPIEDTYKWNSQDVKTALEGILAGFIDPTQPTADYEKKATGIYELNGELHLRDVFLISKTVTVNGEYKPVAGEALPALKKYIRRQLPIGAYRQFKLGDKIQGTLSFGGNKILVENGNLLETTSELIKTYFPELMLSNQVAAAEAVMA